MNWNHLDQMLLEEKCTLESSEYIIKFKCSLGHITEVTRNNFSNRWNKRHEQHLCCSCMFIKRSKEVHGEGKFGYDLVEYRNANEKVKLTCKQCGSVFEITPSKHLSSKQGCGNDACRLAKAKQTCMKLYGVENAFQAEQFKEKIKQTCREKYGVDNPKQSKELQEKAKQTCREVYGCDNPFQSEQAKEKAKQTLLQKYGVDHPMHSAEIKEKVKQSCMAAYGVECSLQAEEVKEKVRQTCRERYGCDNSFQSTEVQEKARQTCREKYGVENVMHSAEIKEKVKQTCLELYGVENVMQSEEFREKVKQTCLELYGVEHAMKSDEIKGRVKKTWLEVYGVDHPSKTKEVREKTKRTNMERYGHDNPMQNPEIFRKCQASAYSRTKVFKFPSGNELKCQGYEPQAFSYLFGITQSKDFKYETYNEEHVQETPQIPYIDSVDKKQRRYTADLYLVKDGKTKLIEVKSSRTMHNTENEKHNQQKNIDKWRASSKLCDTEVWVMRENGTISAIISYQKDCTKPTIQYKGKHEEWDESKLV